ncbi:12010_t:CDS:2, partial [Gigaspora margarita]
KELKILEAKPPKEFWRDDLKSFEDQWNNDLAEFEENMNAGGVTKKGKKRAGL